MTKEELDFIVSALKTEIGLTWPDDFHRRDWIREIIKKIQLMEPDK